MSPIDPFDPTTVQYIPEDPSSGTEGQIVPVSYIQTTQQNIGDFVSNNNVVVDQIIPISESSSSSSVNIIGNSGVDVNAVRDLVVSVPGTITVNEGFSTTLQVSVSVDGSTFQWQKQEAGTSIWTNISGATSINYTTPVLTFANDNGDKYRVIVRNDDTTNSPVTSSEITLNVRRVITITVQPTVANSYPVGTTASFSVTATISSGSAAALQYQWQKQEFENTFFSNVTVSGNTSSYTTPILNTLLDNGDSYRCVVSHPDADSVISNVVTLVVTGADYQITPAINGISFWRLSIDGPLILDPANASEYTVKSLEPARTRIYSRMWGQGSCNAQGGYAEGSIPTVQLQTFTVKLNAGGGTGGNAGGGYAGIFNGTTVNQANALLIAGGAGGGGRTASILCTFSGGTGGGSIGGDGVDASATIGAGDGGTQSAGGAGGVSTNVSSFTTTYSTPGTYDLAIPAGAINITYEIVGGTGGTGGSSSGGTLGFVSGGVGARGQKIVGTLGSSVVNQTLSIRVAGAGGNGTGNNGYDSGGSAGSGYYSGGSGGNQPGGEFNGSAGSGGGGGGASSITLSSNVLLVAGGGGGGAAAYGNSGFPPGPARTSTSLTTTLNGSNGGLGGDGTTSANASSGGGGGGNPGGFGGRYNISGNNISGDGGDGGGGYYNTSYVNTASLETSSTNAYVTITYSLPTQNGSSGTALQGGAGGVGTYTGGGGGGGYWGGGGGSGSSTAAAGGGGSGFVAVTVSGTTSGFANSANPYRSNAGSVDGPSRLVIEQTNIVITQQPVSVIAASGTSATISVTASIPNIPSQVLQYQWQKKESGTAIWNNIAGANSSSYIISSLSTADNGDFYRCILSNPHSVDVTSNEADITVIQSGAVSTVVYRTAGNANFTLPNGVERIRFYMWGAGGDGTGECVSSSGGSGGYISGVIDTVDGDVFLAKVGSTNNGSPEGQSGFGAGRGAGWTGLFKYVSGTPQLVAIAGGGGGAGQAGSGGGGGGNGTGGNGAGPNAGGGGLQNAGGTGAGGGFSGSFYTNGGGTGFENGGASGGTGQGVSRRGGGGGGDQNTNCTGGGGGGGSGYVNTAYLGPSDTSISSSTGFLGSSGGVNPSVTGTVWNNFVSSPGGYQAGRSGNAGLIIFELTYRFDFQVSPAVAGRTNWSLTNDGPLILDGGSATTYTLTSLRTASRTVKMWGQGSATSTGGYSTGTVNFTNASTYTVRLNAGGGSPGAGSGSGSGVGQSGGGYAGLFSTAVINQSNAIMIAGGAGGGAPSVGGSASVVGGTGGGSSGGAGQNSPDTQNGSTGGGGGTQSSGGGAGSSPGGGSTSGSALQGGQGGQGSGSSNNYSGGGGGGGGYYGGGGGGGGNDNGQGSRSASGGGGGSGYINTSVVTGGSTSGFANSGDVNRGNAGSAGYSSRVVIST